MPSPEQPGRGAVVPCSTQRDMCDHQRVGDVDEHVERLPHRRGEVRSQKSWLVAAIEEQDGERGERRAAGRESWRRCRVARLLTNTLTSGSTSPSAWNWISANTPCASAEDAVVTPRCRRL